MTLFDSPDGGSAQRPAPTTWTVAELHETVAAIVEGAFPDRIWVDGEIRDIRRAPNGHVYFRLVDAGDERGVAVLPVTLFRWHKETVNEQLRRLGSRVRMEDGVNVRIRGEVSVWARSSQVQLKMTAIDPAFTLGDLAARRHAVLARLASEGLLHAQSHLSLPLMPLRIALLTSRGSAAEADFCDELDQSGLAFSLSRFDVRVQGDSAAASIAECLSSLDPDRFDAVALVRGGGAQTDLLAFDDEIVARAVATCPIPVIVGVGHEVDDTVADAVAHRSVKTPTAAAGLFIAQATTSHADLELLVADAVDRARRRIDTAASSLDAIAHRVVFSGSRHLDDLRRVIDRSGDLLVERGRRRLDAAGARLDHTEMTLKLRASTRLERARTDIDALAARVTASDPGRLLDLGWTLTTREDGQPLDVATLAAGDRIRTRHRTGTLVSAITDAVASSVSPSEPDRDQTS